MKKITFALMLVFLASCAGKTETTDAKKSDKPVISVLDTTPVKAETKITKPAEEPKATVTPVPGAPAAPTETAAVNKDSPKEVIKSYTAELQSIQDDPNAKGKKREKKIADKVRKFFDFPTLARMSLGSNWNTLTEKKKQNFTDLFTRLIEKSYLARSQNLVGNYQLSYGNEKITGDKATVSCEIYKDDVDLEIVYELHKTTDSWMIYNVVFDQVNLVKNYQSQFNQIIAKSGFNGLTDMMNKKLKDKSSDADAAL